MSAAAPKQLPDPHIGSTNVPESLRLVDAISRFTTERRQETLEASFLQNLAGLLPQRRAWLFRKDENTVMAFSLPSGQSLDPALPDLQPLMKAAEEAFGCFADGVTDARALHFEDGHHYSLHPLFGHASADGILVLEHAPGVTEEAPVVNGLLSIYQNFVKLIDDAHRDTLTGLLNRKTFEDDIRKLLTRHGDPGDAVPMLGERRKSLPDSQNYLAVLDIDHFKRVNDQFGHLYGDEVLLLFSRLMFKGFRRYDQLFRFGGEEFAVVLHQCTPEGATNCLERFRESVAQFSFPQVGTVTVSIGYVTISDQDVPASVVGNADAALYYSKNNGRNQTNRYETLKQRGLFEETAKSSSVDLF